MLTVHVKVVLMVVVVILWQFCLKLLSTQMNQQHLQLPLGPVYGKRKNAGALISQSLLMNYQQPFQDLLDQNLLV